MAVRVFCDNPSELLGAIKTSIRNGSIETWLVDTDGDFTHTPEQWKNKAWFRPVVDTDKIIFNILGPASGRMSRTVYGVYHGRFIEMLLTHFDLKFSRATATALPVAGDYVGNS
jgi:hypothetical protein